MRQQVVTSPGEIEIRDVPKPDINETQVLVKIMRIGICGSDIHVFHGKHPLTSYPVTQGHEISGIIEEVGSEVNSLQPGDKVVIQPQVVCGDCYNCNNGNYHICDSLKVMGFQTTGMASDYFAVNSNLVLKVPSTMTFDEAAMIEPVAVACNAISKIGDPAGKDLVVLGAGPIGNLTAQVAKALGAKSVLITDLSNYRLSLAKQVGIDIMVNPKEQPVKDAVLEHFGPVGADAIIECVGTRQTVNDAIASARKGSNIVLVGVFGDKPAVDLSTVQDHELKLIGMLMYQTKDFIQAIDLVSSDKIQLDPLMSDHFAFDQYKEAYELIDRQRDQVMKIFIDVH